MVYCYIFYFFDAIPTISFSIHFTIIYFALHYFVYKILQRLSKRFNSVSYDKQTSILVNLLESILLGLMSYVGVMALYHGDLNIFNTRQFAPNPQIMINMATMYTVKDLASLLINKRMASTTVLHHICVFLAYFYVLSILCDEDRWRSEEGFFKCFIAHASFTMFAFPVDMYFAVRFFINREGFLNYVLKRFCLVYNIICVSVNLLWQAGYLVYLNSIGMIGAYLPIYVILFLAWTWEEYIVMIYLFKL